MVSTFADDFSVTWQDPADAQLTWLFDPMHMPDPICQLAAEFKDRLYITYMSARCTSVNGYSFSTTPTPRPPSPEILTRGVLDVWMNDYMPRVQETCARLRSRDYDAMSLLQLGDLLEGIMEESVTAFGFTMKPISAFMGLRLRLSSSSKTSLARKVPASLQRCCRGSRTGPPLPVRR